MHLLWLAVLIEMFLPSLYIVMLYQWLDARWSGWKNLARLYRAEHPPTGRRFEKATFSLNARCYCGVATIAMNGDGLYMKLIPLLCVLHPPLVIPWRSMKAITVGSTTEFVLAVHDTVRLRLTEPALHEAIRQLELNSLAGRSIPHRLAG